MMSDAEKQARQEIRDLIDGGVLHPRPWQLVSILTGPSICTICLDEGADVVHEGHATREPVHREPCARLWHEEAKLRTVRMGAGSP